MLKIYPGIERWRTERCPHICPLLQPSAYTFIIYIYICIEAETEIITTRNCYARLWPRIASSYWTITAEASPNTQLVFILYFCINAPQLVSLPLHLSRSQPFVFSSLSPTRSKKKKEKKKQNYRPWLPTTEATLQLTPCWGHCTTPFSSRREQQQRWRQLQPFCSWRACQEGAQQRRVAHIWERHQKEESKVTAAAALMRGAVAGSSSYKRIIGVAGVLPR